MWLVLHIDRNPGLSANIEITTNLINFSEEHRKYADLRDGFSGLDETEHQVINFLHWKERENKDSVIYWVG